MAERTQEDARGRLKRARELAESAPFESWKLLFEGLAIAREALKDGQAKPALLDAYVKELTELSSKVAPDQLYNYFAALRAEAMVASRSASEHERLLSDARQSLARAREDLVREAKQRKSAEDEVKAITQKLVQASGQTGSAQTDARQVREALREAEARTANERTAREEAEKARDTGHGEVEKLRSTLRTREAEISRLRPQVEESRRRLAESEQQLATVANDLGAARARLDDLLAQIGDGRLLRKESVDRLLDEAARIAMEDRPIEVEDATAVLRRRLEEAGDHLREAAENERNFRDQIDMLKKQMDNQRVFLEQYMGVCDALGVDPAKVGELQTRVLGLVARTLQQDGEKKPR